MPPSTNELLFFSPFFLSKIWGGRKLQTEFGYEIPEGKIGECWAISAHPNGPSPVCGGTYDGRGLAGLWAEEPQLFGHIAGDRFPLLIKILDTSEYLSVQVHPDDAYAAEHENGSLGKSECWYILDADEDARIMIGQKAHDRAEFAKMVEAGCWDELLNEIPIHKGDFFSITPGTVHAVKGALILEVQQSSDVTYRVYDFDRPQADGSLRELHMAQELDVIDYGAPLLADGAVTAPEQGGVTRLMDCRYFSVDRVRVAPDAPVSLEQSHPFMCFSVVEGEGGSVTVSPTSSAEKRASPEPRRYELRKGDHFLAPYACGRLDYEGDLELVASYVPNAND